MQFSLLLQRASPVGWRTRPAGGEFLGRSPNAQNPAPQPTGWQSGQLPPMLTETLTGSRVQQWLAKRVQELQPSVEPREAQRFVIEELRIGCSRVVDRLQHRPVCLHECVGVFDQLGDELHRHAEAPADPDDRQAVGVTSRYRLAASYAVERPMRSRFAASVTVRTFGVV